MATIRVADFVINRLYEANAKHIFTISGRGILYLTDAVAKHEKIRCVCTHHEQAAAYAAHAYASCTGGIGACLLSTGCASTNALTGVLCAWQDGVPVVFISGQNMLKETVNFTQLPIRTFGSQEADIIPIVKPVTKYAVMITDETRIAYELEKALYLAEHGVKGPVWIDIPLDIQNKRVDVELLEKFIPTEELPKSSMDDIHLVKTLLHQSKRPVVLIGSGIRSAKAEKELACLIDQYKIPLTYAHSATDIYSLEHTLSIGSVGGIYGTRAGNFTVQNADLILVLGCRMTSMTTGFEKEKFARCAKVVAVDINEAEYLKGTTKVDKLIISDVKHFLSLLLEEDLQTTDEAWQNKCKHWKAIFPKCEEKYKLSTKVDLYYLAEALSEIMPKNAVFLCDAGLEELILPTAITFSEMARCIHPNMQGAMGFALPAAVGAYFGSNGKPICAVIGDGSIMMNLQEFETIRYNQLPLKIFVVENNVYTVIRKRQTDLFRTRTIGTDPMNGVSCPDFEKVAACFGLGFERIQNSGELHQKLKKVFEMPGAVLCAISGVEDQEYICDAYAKNAQKRIVHRPIEDQAPFLDRQLFLEEMIIDPIDQ